MNYLYLFLFMFLLYVSVDALVHYLYYKERPEKLTFDFVFEDFWVMMVAFIVLKFLNFI